MSKKFHVSTGAIVATAESTNRYIAETKRTKTLTREQEKALAEAAAAGDRKAVNTLVESNLRFVIQVARQYQGMGLPLEDLIAFGNIGLFEAAERFDPTKMSSSLPLLCGMYGLSYKRL